MCPALFISENSPILDEICHWKGCFALIPYRSSVTCVTCIYEVSIAVSSYLSHFSEAAPCEKLATERNMGVVTLRILSRWSFGI